MRVSSATVYRYKQGYKRNSSLYTLLNALSLAYIKTYKRYPATWWAYIDGAHTKHPQRSALVLSVLFFWSFLFNDCGGTEYITYVYMYIDTEGPRVRIMCTHKGDGVIYSCFCCNPVRNVCEDLKFSPNTRFSHSRSSENPANFKILKPRAIVKTSTEIA